MTDKSYLTRGVSLKDLLESEKEPVSVVIISHQYLAMLTELSIAIKITGKYKISDKDTEQISRVPLPTKASLLLCSIGKKDPKLVKELEWINKIRNKFAHQMFTKKRRIGKISGPSIYRPIQKQSSCLRKRTELNIPQYL